MHARFAAGPRAFLTLGATTLAAAVLACAGAPAKTGPTESPPERACTLMFVYQGLDIDVSGPAGDAAYRVEVTADGETVTALAHASPPRADGSQDATRCGDGASNEDLGCIARGTGFEVAVTPPMAPDQPARIRVARIGAPGGPAELTVAVSHGAASARRTLRPTYATTEPNGPGCGEVHKAHETLALTAP